MHDDALLGDERRVPLAGIQEVSVEEGWLSHHPLVQGLIGAAALAGGVACCGPLVRGYQEDQTISMSFGFAALFLLGVGGWTLWDATRRGTYLALTTSQGRMKLGLPVRLATDERDQLTDTLQTAIAAAQGA